MKAAIFCGSRDLDRDPKGWSEVARIMDHYLRDGGEHIVIHGDARGADKMFGTKAKGRAEVRAVPAEWDKFGKGAGHRRNKTMLLMLQGYQLEGYEPFVIALCPDELTKGTANMVQQATDAGIPVSVFSCKRGLTRAK